MRTILTAAPLFSEVVLPISLYNGLKRHTVHTIEIPKSGGTAEPGPHTDWLPAASPTPCGVYKSASKIPQTAAVGKRTGSYDPHE